MTIYPEVKREIRTEQRDIGEHNPKIISTLRVSTHIQTGDEFLLIAEFVTWDSHWPENEVRNLIMSNYEKFIASVHKYQTEYELQKLLQNPPS